MPKALVALTVYNDEKYLAEALQSILSQSFTDFIFLVVDDGSTDASSHILHSFSQKDTRLRVLTLEKNTGRPQARNVALEAALQSHAQEKTPYLFWMDGDDISMPQRLEKQIGYMETHQDISEYGTALQCFHEADHTIKPALSHSVLKAQALWISPIVSATACLRLAHVAEHHLRYDTQLLRVEDYAFWLDMLFTTPLRMSNSAQPLYKYRYFHRPTNVHYHALAAQRLLHYLGLPHDLYSAQKHSALANSSQEGLPPLPPDEVILWANAVYEAVLQRQDIALKPFLRITSYKVQRFLQLTEQGPSRNKLMALYLSLPLGQALHGPQGLLHAR